MGRGARGSCHVAPGLKIQARGIQAASIFQAIPRVFRAGANAHPATPPEPPAGSCASASVLRIAAGCARFLGMATIATTDQPPATPEEIWALLRETDRIVKETARQMRETDRRMQEAAKRQEETDRQMRETAKQMRKTDRKMRETDWEIDELQQNLGALNYSMEDLLETLLDGRLWEKFAGYPYNLQRAQPKVPVHDENHRVLTDIDILLWDGEWVMAVEVMRVIKDERESAEEEDVVARHVRRMSEIRRYSPATTVGKKLLGAIAAVIVEPNTREKAHNAGFFVLEMQGESVGLATPPAGFEPRVW